MYVFRAVQALSLAVGLCGADAALAQTYPAKPIRMLASEPGAQVDAVARLVAKGISTNLGQAVIVDNRPGFIAVETAAKAPPDGYTIVIYASSVWVSPLLQKVTFDPVRDLSPITLATNAPLLLFTNPTVPARNVKELIALAKAKPGELNYGSSSAGTANHLAAELFKSMANIDIVRIPYKGTGPAAVGLLANQVQMMFGSAASGMAQVKSGKLRVLGVGSAKPSALAPDVPTISASGVPGYEAAAQSCIWAPAHTPSPVVHLLQREVARVLSEPDTKEKLLAGGVETVGSTPEQTDAYIKADIAKWAKVIKSAGIRIE
jgi:tripartite-type tricarboxylate transporter receptor subunit TctC